jgi:hypothetical protein
MSQGLELEMTFTAECEGCGQRMELSRMQSYELCGYDQTRTAETSPGFRLLIRHEKCPSRCLAKKSKVRRLVERVWKKRQSARQNDVIAQPA